ncbi:MAG TPA: hypothetical protein VF629_24350 [Hymenobacter sp.]|uniref:hypothetical protein n=1 Tax=Hymenobacter sp. TaxID=1898978 RepID=UPI002EDA075F
MSGLSAHLAVGQSTSELLNAKRVNHFIVLKPDVRNKTLGYFLDNDVESRNVKTIRGKPCFAVVERGDPKQLRVESAYLNPFKYRVVITDTALTDPAFESVSKFLAVVETLSGQLAKGGATKGVEGYEAPKEPTATAAVKAQLTTQSGAVITSKGKKVRVVSAQTVSSIIRRNASTNKLLSLIGELNAPPLHAWAYQVQVDSARLFWLAPTDTVSTADMARARVVLQKLVEASRLYYQPDTAKQHFLKRVKAGLDEVAAARTFAALQASQVKFKAMVGEAKTFNARSEAALTSFMDEQNRDLPAEHRKNSPAALAFTNFTRQTFAEFETAARAIQATREQIAEALASLDGDLDQIAAELSGSGTSYHLATLYLNEEKMRDFTVSIYPRVIGLDANGGITVEEGGALIQERLRLRASKKLIPEFATGLFYTNLQYGSYGTETVGTETRVVKVAPRNYRGILAAHLNLVWNQWDGLIHPLAQIGVGTGKFAPTLLAGGGLRFSQPKHLAVTGGAVWTWREGLDQLAPGSLVTGTAQLEEARTLTLNPRPKMYIGLQYSF